MDSLHLPMLDFLHINLQPLDYFIQAGPIGKAVIALLLIASVWCWVLIIEGVVSIMRFGSALRSWRNAQMSPLLTPVLDAGRESAARVIPGEGIGEARQRITEAMNRRARAIIASLEGGLANLAVISSVAPFVGLFGTVWGIMSSFTAIADAKDTSLAIVAPGIAEALATTAVGLAAAIPASIGYTRIGSAIAARSQQLADAIEERAVDFISRTRAPAEPSSIPTKEAA